VRRVGLLAVVLSAACAACTPHDQFAREVTGGDVDRGRMAIRQYGCQTCHVIPGVTGADRIVGPPLHGMASRVYIGGVLINSSDNMIAWLKDPQAFEPRSAMPALGLTDQDARDITAYLYTLR
jgi:cytochrome c